LYEKYDENGALIGVKWDYVTSEKFEWLRKTAKNMGGNWNSNDKMWAFDSMKTIKDFIDKAVKKYDASVLTKNTAIPSSLYTAGGNWLLFELPLPFIFAHFYFEDFPSLTMMEIICANIDNKKESKYLLIMPTNKKEFKKLLKSVEPELKNKPVF
jgi:hypothetical protein